MVEILGTICSVLAVIGVWYNNKRIIWCFPIWLVSNSISGGLHVHAHLWSLAGRDFVFLLLAVHGWRCWRKKQ